MVEASALALLERRARQHKSRWIVCRRGYRERALAAGVWFRLRRLLTYAEAAFVIPPATAAALQAEGHLPDPVGAELEPPLHLVFLPRARAAALPEARPLVVRLGAELLTARWVALVPFDGIGAPPPLGDQA